MSSLGSRLQYVRRQQMEHHLTMIDCELQQRLQQHDENNEKKEKTAEATYTAESEKSVKRAIEWLRKTMNRDGGCGVDVGQTSDIGCSCMVGLALLARGNTPVEGARKGDLKRIRAYLIKQTERMPKDDITSATNTQLQRKIYCLFRLLERSFQGLRSIRPGYSYPANIKS